MYIYCILLFPHVTHVSCALSCLGSLLLLGFPNVVTSITTIAISSAFASCLHGTFSMMSRCLLTSSRISFRFPLNYFLVAFCCVACSSEVVSSLCGSPPTSCVAPGTPKPKKLFVHLDLQNFPCFSACSLFFHAPALLAEYHFCLRSFFAL